MRQHGLAWPTSLTIASGRRIAGREQHTRACSVPAAGTTRWGGWMDGCNTIHNSDKEGLRVVASSWSQLHARRAVGLPILSRLTWKHIDQSGKTISPPTRVADRTTSSSQRIESRLISRFRIAQNPLGLPGPDRPMVSVCGVEFADDDLRTPDELYGLCHRHMPRRRVPGIVPINVLENGLVSAPACSTVRCEQVEMPHFLPSPAGDPASNTCS